MDDLDHWFVDQILPHEAALERYIRRFEPNEVSDVRQEVYVRAYDSARRQFPREARPFLFVIARNLLIDRVRRQRVVQIDQVAEIESLSVESDEIAADRVLVGRAELKRVMNAIDALPPRCREVVRLRKIEQMPPREIARQLGIAVDTVDKHIAKAMRILASQLAIPASSDQTPQDREAAREEQR